MSRSILFLVFLSLLAAPASYAANLPAVINLSLSADLPSNGLQELAITNETGSSNGCSAMYEVCDTLAITNWTLTLTYTSTFYNNPTPVLASPYVLHWQNSGDNILATAAKTLDFDLCNGASVSSCTTPTTVITRIDFTGTLDQSSFAIFDPAANGGTGGPGPTFFANPTFSVTLTPTGDYPGNYFESTDGYVADQAQNVVAPEPGSTLLLLIGGLCGGAARIASRAGARKIFS